LAVATANYILYLNSDMNVDGLRLSELVTYMDKHQKVGIVTPRVNLTSGQIDPASHRGFPTPWRSLCYFSGLERFFALLRMTSRWFGGYHLLERSLDTEHEIETCTGAFLLIRGDMVRELGGFDERFFMYGEDLDLCYRVKEKGLQVIWLPTQKVVHLKHSSGIGSVSTETRRKISAHFYEAMWLFYEKHYSQRYPMWVSVLVRSGIWLKSHL
jgi:GT2 family glycosyltransferase